MLDILNDLKDPDFSKVISTFEKLDSIVKSENDIQNILKYDPNVDSVSKLYEYFKDFPNSLLVTRKTLDLLDKLNVKWSKERVRKYRVYFDGIKLSAFSYQVYEISKESYEFWKGKEDALKRLELEDTLSIEVPEHLMEINLKKERANILFVFFDDDNLNDYGFKVEETFTLNEETVSVDIVEITVQDYHTKTNNLDFGPTLHGQTKNKDKYFAEYWQSEDGCVVMDIEQVGIFNIHALKTSIAFDPHYGTGFTDKSFSYDLSDELLKSISIDWMYDGLTVQPPTLTKGIISYTPQK